MSEPAARGVTSERDVLLAAKLNVPGLRPGLMPRPRLAQRLDEGLGLGLVLARAPADVGGLAIAMDAALRTDTGCWWPAPTHAESVMPSAGKYRYRMTGG